MRRTVLLAVGLATVLASSPSARAAQKPASPCVAILVASSEETPKNGWGTKFSATKTTDLTFTVLFLQGFTGEHIVELRVFTPRGFLYQSMSVPAAVAGLASGTRTVSGYPHPVPVKASSRFAYQGSTLWKVDVPFPVGGTEIGRNSLYGTWKAQAYLDGSPNPCGAATTFRIGP